LHFAQSLPPVKTLAWLGLAHGQLQIKKSMWFNYCMTFQRSAYNSCISSCQWYAFPVANRYAVLSNHREPQECNDKIFSNSEQTSRFVTANNHKYVKRLRRRKTISMNQTSLPMNHQLNKPNLQEPRKNEDGTCSFLTIVNGVTNVNLNPKFELKYSDSIGNLIKKLRETINVCNRNKYSLSKNTE